jgi:type IX secretion system PorP/SprF family membrane protein
MLKNKFMKKVIVFFITMAMVLDSYALDPAFSQFNAASLYYNPGFSGIAEKSRLVSLYRNQWNSLYQTGYLSYDQAVKKLHGGAGIIVFNDNSTKLLNVFYSGLTYTAKFNLSDKIAISPGIKIGYRRTSFNATNEYLPLPLSFYTTEDFKPNSNKIDIAAGVILNTEKFYAGLALDHINKPELGLRLGPGPQSFLPMKYIIQAGYIFQKDTSSDFSASASILYQNMGYFFSLLQTNVSFRYKFITGGLAYSTSATYTGMLGYHGKKIDIAYSIDYYAGYSELSPFYSFAHEISLKYFFTLKKKVTPA